MMRNRFVRFLIVIPLFFLALYAARTSLISKEINIRTPDKLDWLLARHDVAVLLLYDRSCWRGSNPELQKILTVFRQTSRDPFFKNAGLQFFAVDVGNKRCKWLAVCNEWQVQQLPAVLICNCGEIVLDDTGRPEVLYNLSNRRQLTSFIEDILGAQLQQTIDQKDADRKRRLQEARIQFYESSYDPLPNDYAGDYSWAYPYWGYGYGYPLGSCGYMGIGFGW